MWGGGTTEILKRVREKRRNKEKKNGEKGSIKYKEERRNVELEPPEDETRKKMSTLLENIVLLSIW